MSNDWVIKKSSIILKINKYKNIFNKKSMASSAPVRNDRTKFYRSQTSAIETNIFLQTIVNTHFSLSKGIKYPPKIEIFSILHVNILSLLCLWAPFTTFLYNQQLRFMDTLLNTLPLIDCTISDNLPIQILAFLGKVLAYQHRKQIGTSN